MPPPCKLEIFVLNIAVSKKLWTCYRILHVIWLQPGRLGCYHTNQTCCLTLLIKEFCSSSGIRIWRKVGGQVETAGWGHIFKGCSLQKGSANLYFCWLFPVWGHTFFFFFFLLIDTGIQDWTLNCNCLKIVFTVHLEYTANEPLIFLLQLSVVSLVSMMSSCLFYFFVRRLLS